MSEAMELTDETLETIGGYVRRNLSIWMNDVVRPMYVQLEPQVLERMVRVEETLSAQRELLKQSLEQTDRHFSEQREDFAARFEQIDRRFDEQREAFAARFQEQREDSAARWQEQREDLAARFQEQREDLAARIQEQREDIAARFQEQRSDFTALFGTVDKRFDDIQRNNTRWMTVISIMLGLIGVAVTVTNLL